MPVFTSPFYDEAPPDLGGNEVWARQHGHHAGGDERTPTPEPAHATGPQPAPARPPAGGWAWTVFLRAPRAG